MKLSKIVIGSISYVYYYRYILLKSLWLPLIALTALEVANESVENILPGIILLSINFFIYTIIAVITHRIIILGNLENEYSKLKWTKRETNFLLHLLLFIVLATPVSILAVHVPLYFTIAALLLVLIIFSKISLVFPAIAIDKPITIKESWELTNNFTLHMFFIITIYPIFLTLLLMPLYLIPYSYILISLISTVTVIFTISALSVAYKLILNGHSYS